MLHHIEHTIIGAPLDQSARTEAVQFSPSGEDLLVADSRGQIFHFSVDTSTRPIRVLLRATYTSNDFRRPHAVDFLSDKVIAVANRLGRVEIFQLPELSDQHNSYSIDSIFALEAEWFGAIGETLLDGNRTIAAGPGALVFQDGQLYVGSNLKNVISAHSCDLIDNNIVVRQNLKINEDTIHIPDAIAISCNGDYLAIGDHGNQRAAVLDSKTGELLSSLQHPELIYPHGVRFDITDKNLVVTDAGGQGLHVFSTNNDWSSNSQISYSSIEGISQEKFDKTQSEVNEQYRPLEGGIKGICYNAASKLFVTTCRYQTLRFFALG